MILELEALEMRFGGIKAVDRVSYTIDRNKVHAIIGPNGAGKTTLFNMITGVHRPSGGRIRLDGQDVTGLPPERLAARGMCRTFQNLQIFEQMTALENVMVGRHRHEHRGVLGHVFRSPALRASEAFSRARSLELLALVGLAAWADHPAGALPYGAMKRLEIARALASEPRLLLLDEPAAGCNATETGEIDAVIRALPGRGIAVVLIEHDMPLVMNLAHHILVLDHGRKLAEGTAEAIRANPEVIAAYLGTQGQEGAHARH